MKVSDPRSDPLLSAFANLRTMRWLSLADSVPCHVPVIVCPWSTVHIDKAKPAQYRNAALRTSLLVMPD